MLPLELKIVCVETKKNTQKISRRFAVANRVMTRLLSKQWTFLVLCGFETKNHSRLQQPHDANENKTSPLRFKWDKNQNENLITPKVWRFFQQIDLKQKQLSLFWLTSTSTRYYLDQGREFKSWLPSNNGRQYLPLSLYVTPIITFAVSAYFYFTWLCSARTNYCWPDLTTNIY